MLALIRARSGYSAALDVASLYIYEEVRIGSDVQPIVSTGRIRQHEPRVAEAIRIMETHIDGPLTIATIAHRVGLSTRGLETLFLRIVDVSPGAYYLTLRLNAARRLVVDNQSADRRHRRAHRLLRHRLAVPRLPPPVRPAALGGAKGADVGRAEVSGWSAVDPEQKFS